MIKNYTPHAIRLRVEASNEAIPLASDVVYEPAGPAVRLETKSVIVGYVDDYPIKKTVLGAITGLPEPEDGVVYIVSLPVAQRAAALGRTDVFSPNTAPGEDIRYPQGHKLKGLTFAVRGFQTF